MDAGNAAMLARPGLADETDERSCDRASAGAGPRVRSRIARFAGCYERLRASRNPPSSSRSTATRSRPCSPPCRRPFAPDRSAARRLRICGAHVVEAFNRGDLDVLVATDAAGEGIEPASPLQARHRSGAAVESIAPRAAHRPRRSARPATTRPRDPVVSSAHGRGTRARAPAVAATPRRPVERSRCVRSMRSTSRARSSTAGCRRCAGIPAIRSQPWCRRRPGRWTGCRDSARVAGTNDRRLKTPSGYRPDTRRSSQLVALHTRELRQRVRGGGCRTRVRACDRGACTAHRAAWRDVVVGAVPDRVATSLRSTRRDCAQTPSRANWRLSETGSRPASRRFARRWPREHTREIQQSLFDRRADDAAAHADEAALTARHGVGTATGERHRRHLDGVADRWGGVALARAASGEVWLAVRTTAVVAGFGGDLISHAYVEQELLPAAGGMSRDRLAAFERQLTRWWRQVSRSLGPASSARTVLDVAVAPLLHLLGHDRPVVTPHPLGLCGSISGSDVSIVALPWSTPGENRVARRRDARPRRPHVVGDGQQRPIAQDRRLHTHLDSSWPGVRLRDPDRQSERRGRAVVAGQRGRRCERRAPDRCAPASSRPTRTPRACATRSVTACSTRSRASHLH